MANDKENIDDMNEDLREEIRVWFFWMLHCRNDLEDQSRCENEWMRGEGV